MAKHGPMTAKAIGNRIKDRGLKKLRWYCQMCEKQCRDENGFKNHASSEGHQRQLLLVAENPNKFVDQFSQEFKQSFLHHLRRRYNTRRVSANIVYNEYIADKSHLHMNATRWETLTGFVKYLGREGYCVVDETPKGWFIQYIDRDPETLELQRQAERDDARKKSEEERQLEAVQAQVERDREAAAARGELNTEVQSTELQRENDEEKIVISLAPKAKEAAHAQSLSASLSSPLEEGHSAAATPSHSHSHSHSSSSSSASSAFPQAAASSSSSSIFLSASSSSSSARPQKAPEDMKRKMSALDLIMQEEEAKKKAKLERDLLQKSAAASHHHENWLHEGIVVKILNKELKDGKFYKKKGVVLEVIDKFTARIQLLEASTILKLDQEFLETVLPAIGGHVLVVNGPERGRTARLEELDVDNFKAIVSLLEGPRKGKEISAPYEDICKLDESKD